jgi:outer membrane protein assembly factor BamB
MNNMKHLESKTKFSTIAIITILTLSAIIVAVPFVGAQPGTTWQTWAVCDVIPDQVGVNQPVLVAFGLTRQTAWPQAGWYDITVTVTRPDGQTETLGPFMTDTTGLSGTAYTPTQVGTYTFVTNFPEQEIEETAAGVEAGTTMLASTSDPITLTVTQEPLEYFPAAMQPTSYWTRPIDAQNREWAWFAGSYLDGSYIRNHNRYVPGNDGPETAHILWEYIQDQGGLVGTQLTWDNINSFETGDAYEGKWANPVIVAGILVGNAHPRGTQTSYAIDLRTGEELWRKELGDNIDFGQIMYWDTMNMHGAFAYVWSTQGSTWRAWDPLTGRNEYNMTDVPGGTRVIGPNGEIMLYSISTRSNTISIWNSTAAYYDWQLALEEGDPQAAYHAGRWRPIGQEFDASYGTQFEGSIPADLPGGVEVVIPEYRAIGGNTNWAGGAPEQNPQYWAIDLRPGHIGQLVFNQPWPIPEQGLHVDFSGSHPFSVEYDLFIVTAKETRKHYALSMSTGQQLWATDWFEPYFNAFANVYMDPWGQVVCAEDYLLTAGFGGVLNAYNLADGSHAWEYKLSDPYSEQLFGNNWPAPVGFVTDGKVYLFHMEHSVINPMPRGAPAACVDLATGTEIWRVNGIRLGTRWGGQPIIGDSIIVGFSSYDNTITALGKGPSQTTVETPNTGASKGSKLLLSGTVMDISPGTKDPKQMMRFPDGVPCVADASMSEWMLYVYKTEQAPDMPMGVTVYLEAIDPDGEYLYIGETTTDMYGNYGLEFTPGKEGKYMIMASFKESGAYYGSTDTAYVAVGPALTPAGPITPEPEPTHGLISTEVAIILVAAIAAIVIVAFLVMRKRK